MPRILFHFLTGLSFTLIPQPVMAQGLLKLVGLSFSWEWITAIIILVVVLYLLLSLKLISGNTAFVVVSRLAKYNRAVGPGAQFLIWPIEAIEESFPSTQLQVELSNITAAVRGETRQEWEQRTQNLSLEDKLKDPQLSQPAEVTINPTLIFQFPKVGRLSQSDLIEIAKVWPSVPGEFASELEQEEFRNKISSLFTDFLADVFQQAINQLGSWRGFYLDKRRLSTLMNGILHQMVSQSSQLGLAPPSATTLLSLIPSELIQITLGEISIPESYRLELENLGSAALQAASTITLTEAESKRLQLLIQVVNQDPSGSALALQELEVYRSLAAEGKLNVNNLRIPGLGNLFGNP